ncbi:MAG TPA: PAS domain S-box protein, partial [Longimicrobiales bacterium]
MPDDVRTRQRDAESRAHAAEQRILVAIAENRSLPELLQVVATGLEEQIEGAYCSVIVERSGRLEVVAPGHLPAPLLAAIPEIDPARVDFGAGPVVVEDFEPLPAVGYRNLALESGIRSLVSMPLHADATARSMLAVHRTVPGPLPPHELALATRAAGIAGVLIERAAVEGGLRESEQRLRQIAESLSEGIWISTIDNQALYVSPSCAEIIGIPLEEMYANGLGFLRLVHPDDRVRLERWAANPADLSTEFRLNHPDGRMRWLRTQIMPIRNAEGVFYRYAGVVEDITPWKDALARVHESEAHYRRLVDAAPVGIYAVGADGLFTEVNPATEAILDRSAREVIGHHFAEVVAPQDMEKTNAMFLRLMRGESSTETLELSIVRRNGEQRLLTLTVTALREGGVVTGVQGIASDVTDERQREIQLRRAERLASVGTLIGGVAHELNNPLTAVVGFAHLMLLDERTHEDRETLETMAREA